MALSSPFLSLALLCAPALVPSTHAALLSYWNMNETAGSIADRTGNTSAAAASASGLSYAQSTVTPGSYGSITVSADRAALFGSSIYFDKANSGRFTLTSPQIAALATAGSPGSGQFTVMGWVNPDAMSSATKYRMFSTGSPGGWGFGLGNVDQVAFTNFGAVDKITTTAPVPGNNANWYHVAASWNNGQVSVYVNGNLQATGGTANNNFVEEAQSLFSIGANAGASPTEFFSGYMDELKIFNTAMTAEQIRFAAITVPEPGTASLGILGMGLLALRRKR